MKNTTKGFSIPIALIIILVVLVGGYYVYKSSDSTLEDEDTTIIEDYTQGESDEGALKTYRNDKYGFSFKYPEDWVVRELSDPVRFGGNLMVLKISSEEFDEYAFPKYSVHVAVNCSGNPSDSDDDITEIHNDRMHMRGGLTDNNFDKCGLLIGLPVDGGMITEPQDYGIGDSVEFDDFDMFIEKVADEWREILPGVKG